jgi:hypothetical protein
MVALCACAAIWNWFVTDDDADGVSSRYGSSTRCCLTSHADVRRSNLLLLLLPLLLAACSSSDHSRRRISGVLFIV